MAKYVLLRIADDAEADLLLRDIALHPHSPLLTPRRAGAVWVEVVPDLDEGDFRPGRASFTSGRGDSVDRARGLRAVLRRSYLRASKLAAEWEESA